MKKKFGMVIGNPPYQEDNGIDKSRKAPVYNTLMEVAHKVADQTILITPARFLFDAGGTPKDFNQRMLNDPHFKVLEYEPDASKYFSGVNIEGGVAVTLYDHNKTFEPIGTFIPFDELKIIHQKVCLDNPAFRPFSEIIYSPIIYKLSEKFFGERPELVRKLQKSNETTQRTGVHK